MITKPKTKKTAAEFIAAAPDATAPAAAERKNVRGQKAQISFTIAPALLDRLDALAERRGMSRVAMLALAISNEIERSN